MCATKVTFGIQNIFSSASRERCLTSLKKIPIPKFGKKPPPKESAAILVPLCEVNGVPSMLFTVRSPALRTNSGEVAFPGGKAEPHETAINTALRETEEEIGLQRIKVDVWGEAPTVPGRGNKISITPVIGSISNLHTKDLRINTKEVSEVFTVALDKLCDPRNHFHTQYKNGFILPVFVADSYKIWGITAFITHAVLSSLLSKDVYYNDWMKRKVYFDKTLLQ